VEEVVVLVEVEGREVVTRVLVGGPLSNNKGISLPGVRVSAPSMSEKDHADLIVGQKLGVDFLALSFVRSAQDIHDAHEAILAVLILSPHSMSSEKSLIQSTQKETSEDL
jgi:pyruvate kinase